jgi:hypothetical protein
VTDLSDYTETLFANFFRAQNITAPTNVYVALFSTMPGEDGVGGVEATTTVRPAGRLTATFGAPSGGQISNSSDVNFGQSAGAVTLVGAGIYDAVSGGNLLALKAFDVARSVLVSANVRFATGTLNLIFR